MSVPSQRQRPYVNGSYLFYLLVTTISLLLVFSRRPDAFLNPQFWAEDGRVWYADAYNHGLIYSLFTPEAGYYQTASRLVAMLAQLFPLAYGPLIFNLIAIAVKLIVVNFLVSSRLDHLIPNRVARVAIAFIYLALPHSYETHANLTNVQWHFALLSFLILIAGNAKTLAGRVFDFAVVLVSALSGPLCVLLAPIAAIKYLNDRQRRTLILTAIFTIGALIQITALLTTDRPSSQPLGADFGLGMKITAGHLFVSGIVGQLGNGFAIKHSLLNDITATVINLLGSAMVLYAFVRARLELRLLIVFSILIICTAMASPAITNSAPQWTVMWLPEGGSRYWLIPIFCLFVTLLFLAAKAELAPIRYLSMAALVVSLTGIAADWRYMRFTDLDFQSHAKQFERAAPGEEVPIPINPNWEMRLKKKE